MKKTTVVKRKPFACTNAPAIVGPTKFPNENPDNHKPKIIKSSMSCIIQSGDFTLRFSTRLACIYT